MRKQAQRKVPLYVRIAERFIHQVANGVLRPGDRVPSLRRLSKEQGVSLSTALQAYLWLENRGYLEARPQSGFYIRTPFAKLIPEPQSESIQSQPPQWEATLSWKRSSDQPVIQRMFRSARDAQVRSCFRTAG